MDEKYKVKISYVAISDRGLIRKENQDNLYCNGIFRQNLDETETLFLNGSVEKQGLFAVADGMGGECNGAEASYEAVKNLSKLSHPVLTDMLKEYIFYCNQTICHLIEQSGGMRMGTTFAGLSIHDGKAEIVTIGDSRVYLFREGRLHCLSKDDTVIQSLLDAGLLSYEMAKKHPDRHRLTQHIGIFSDEMIIEPHAERIAVHREDIYLLCSDGLTDGIDDAEIATILKKESTIQEILHVLYQSSLARSKDNITIILVKIS